MYSRTIGHVGALLLVEDEPFVREATCCILESAGFEVLPAEDAQDAMKVYEECKRGIDLVMTDMVLPGRSGERLGQDLREQSPQGRGAGDVRFQQPGVRDGKARVANVFSGEAVFEADAGRED
jgi:CheY-like chemotaxis protein